MEGNRISCLGLCLYACISTFFFVYAMPFIFTGLHRNLLDDPMLSHRNRTVLDVVEGVNYAALTNYATYFAEQMLVRSGITLLIIIFSLVLQFVSKNILLKLRLFQFIIWFSFIVYLLNFFGLVLVL